MPLITQVAKSVGRNVRDLLLVSGVGPKLREHNREVLEQLVMPGVASLTGVERVLFVGCHWYTWHYDRYFPNQEYMTLEIDPARARYGSRHRHIVDSAENLDDHFQPDSLDAVFLIGVIGWGLDDTDAIEVVLDRCRTALKDGGLLVLGVDDVPQYMPVDLKQSPTLRAMKPFVLPSLEVSEFTCEGELNHVFRFLRKADGYCTDG